MIKKYPMNALSKLLLALSVFVTLVLAACSPSISATQIASVPHATASPSAFPTATLALQQTPTPNYRATTSVIQTKTAYRDATQTALAFIQTQNMTATLEAIPAAVMAATQPNVIQTFISPDGQWQADIVVYDCVQVGGPNFDENAYEQLIIVKISDGMETVAADQLLNCGGVGAGGLDGLFWSPNSRYFYFDYAREGVPDGCCCGLWHQGTSRVDTETGLVETLPGEGPLTPDGMMMIWTNQEFVLWRLDEGEIARSPYPVENLTFLSMQLSPEGDRLVYVMVQSCQPASGNSLVVLFTPADRTHTILVESNAPTFTSARWETSTLLILQDSEGQSWHYNLDTGKLTPSE